MELNDRTDRLTTSLAVAKTALGKRTTPRSDAATSAAGRLDLLLNPRPCVAVQGADDLTDVPRWSAASGTPAT
jgi:hypothetical protein